MSQRHITHLGSPEEDQCPACAELFSMKKKYTITINREFDTQEDLAEIFAEIMVLVNKNIEVSGSFDDIICGVGWDIEPTP